MYVGSTMGMGSIMGMGSTMGTETTTMGMGSTMDTETTIGIGFKEMAIVDFRIPETYSLGLQGLNSTRTSSSSSSRF